MDIIMLKYKIYSKTARRFIDVFAYEKFVMHGHLFFVHHPLNDNFSFDEWAYIVSEYSTGARLTVPFCEDSRSAAEESAVEYLRKKTKRETRDAVNKWRKHSRRMPKYINPEELKEFMVIR